MNSGINSQTQANYQIMYQGQAIGSSRLEYRDSAMGIAFGRFYPLPAYDLVRDVFLLFIEAGGDTHVPDQTKLAAYYHARDALNLTLVAAEGHPVSTSWIHIYDLGELGREVEAQIQHDTFRQMSDGN